MDMERRMREEEAYIADFLAEEGRRGPAQVRPAPSSTWGVGATEIA